MEGDLVLLTYSQLEAGVGSSHLRNFPQDFQIMVLNANYLHVVNALIKLKAF